MARRYYTRCKCCNGHWKDVGEMSRTGLCVTCGDEIFRENALQISAGHGFAHRRRLRGIANYLERSYHAELLKES